MFEREWCREVGGFDSEKWAAKGREAEGREKEENVTLLSGEFLRVGGRLGSVGVWECGSVGVCVESLEAAG